MFADSAKVFIKSGKGGDGHVSFRRELYVANGGPDGGDGGRGGDIIFEVDDGLNTLTDFRHVRKYVAGSGEEGGKRRCHGADGKDLVIKVPEGTVIKDFESGKVIADMSGENRREIILKGGKGGLGNMHFATSTMQVFSSITTRPPDPIMAPIFERESKSILLSSCDSTRQPPEGPPIWTALNFLLSLMPPPISKMISRRLIPIGTSIRPVFLTFPVSANALVPGLSGVPIRLYQPAPFLMIIGTLA